MWKCAPPAQTCTARWITRPGNKPLYHFSPHRHIGYNLIKQIIVSEIEEIPVNEIDLFSRQSRILPCSINCLPKNIRTVFFTCRDADIPLNQHGAHAAERINNLCILYQIRRCQFHNQCRKRRVHGSCNCMFPVRKPVIRKGIKSQCREKLSLTICNQSKFYLIIPRRIHQFSIRHLFNGRSKLFDKPASLFQ